RRADSIVEGPACVVAVRGSHRGIGFSDRAPGTQIAPSPPARLERNGSLANETGGGGHATCNPVLQRAIGSTAARRYRNARTYKRNFRAVAPDPRVHGHLQPGFHARPVHLRAVAVRDGNHGVHLRRRRKLARLLSGPFPKAKGG